MQDPDPNPDQAMQDLQIEQEKLQQAKKAEAEAVTSTAVKARTTSKNLSQLERGARASSAGVCSVKMPAKVTQTTDDPNVLFLQMCELGDPIPYPKPYPYPYLYP